MRITFLFVLSMLPLTCLAQNPTIVDGSARAVAISHSTAAIPGMWNTLNPGSWATDQPFRAAFAAGRVFSMAELSPVSAGVIVPLPFGNAGVRIRTYGFEAYRQTDIRTGWALSVSPGTHRSIHLGVQGAYTHLDQSDYGSAGAVGINIGAIAPISQVLHVGAFATNINVPTIQDHELPRVFGMGMAYQASDNAQITTEVRKDIDHAASLRAGVEWKPVEVLALRLGSASAPTRFSAGAGVNLGAIRMDIGGVHHPDLGWSPIATMEVEW